MSTDYLRDEIATVLLCAMHEEGGGPVVIGNGSYSHADLLASHLADALLPFIERERADAALGTPDPNLTSGTASWTHPSSPSTTPAPSSSPSSSSSSSAQLSPSRTGTTGSGGAA